MLSILIVNWNTRDLLGACLASIRRFPPSDPYEVIVVDNASSDGSAALVAEQYPTVRLLEPGTNLGYAAGNNLAFAHAEGEFLLTLNPDTEFVDESLQRAVAFMEGHPDIGVLGARLVDPGPEGRTQPSVRGFPSLVGIFGDATGLGRLFPRAALGSYRLRAFDYERGGPAPQPMGTFLLFRRSAIEAAGVSPKAPFDESFPIFFNEVDLLRQMADAGFPAWYEPSVGIVHHGGASTRQIRPSMIWESHRSLLRYLRKHSSGAGRAVVLPIVAALVWLAALVRARGWSPGFRP
ncbi:MAG TPA: glycosyltransferase family 2 protein [Fimbriimonadaceae bacterium]|nr:glycosyltransferase family 2 protein [Fimbriimonadaceae bacterium]HRJ97736.1 glycosyltransferase family 2 protein [Fimbriimonadaceae bacterium]